jgi:putative phosphoesterase
MKKDMAHRHEARSIILPDDKICIIAVISDTHGKPHPNLFPILKEKHPSMVLHAGDIGDLRLITELDEISKTVFVRGNIDPAGQTWPDSISLRIKFGKSVQFDLLLLHMAITRVKLKKEIWNLFHQNPAQIVVFGHSHIPFLGMEGKICLFNPGSAGPSRMRLPTTMGFMEVLSGQLKFKHLDLQTGEQWIPGRE